MDQVIAALDELRGSSDWRRFGYRTQESGENKTLNTRGLFFIGEEDETEKFRKMAMDLGARGATSFDVEMNSFSRPTQEKVRESNSRCLCDIITSRDIEEKLIEQIKQTGFSNNESSWVLKSFDAETGIPSAFRS
jgi:hypothetical protein